MFSFQKCLQLCICLKWIVEMRFSTARKRFGASEDSFSNRDEFRVLKISRNSDFGELHGSWQIGPRRRRRSMPPSQQIEAPGVACLARSSRILRNSLRAFSPKRFFLLLRRLGLGSCRSSQLALLAVSMSPPTRQSPPFSPGRPRRWFRFISVILGLKKRYIGA